MEMTNRDAGPQTRRVFFVSRVIGPRMFPEILTATLSFRERDGMAYQEPRVAETGSS